MCKMVIFKSWQLTPCWSVYLSFEKSSCKNQVRQTGFTKLVFAGYPGSKNQVWNRLKIQFVELIFPNWIFRYQIHIDQQGVRVWKQAGQKKT